MAPPSTGVKSRNPSFPRRLLRALWRLATDREYRSLVWLQRMRPKGVFQPNNDTFTDRYPQIFSAVQSQLGGDGHLRILSFGCSTGEEVFTLRRYFPHAAIKGIDINSANIAACRSRLRDAPDPRIAFEEANSTASEPAAVYDAIFCMSVLRHGGLAEPGITRCDHLIRFADFAAAVEDFRRCLKSGGLLVIRNSNFRLSDAPAGAHFITSYELEAPLLSPIFGPDNRLLPGIGYSDTVFRKAPD